MVKVLEVRVFHSLSNAPNGWRLYSSRNQEEPDWTE